METISINKLITLLEVTRKEWGGGARVRIYDRRGDDIKPTRMEDRTTIQGNRSIDWLAFTEDP